MKRLTTAFAVICLLIVAGSASAQSKESRVKYRGAGGKEESARGIITEESLEGITIKTDKHLRNISALDIIDVEYGVPTLEATRALRQAVNFEVEDKKYEAAIRRYQDVTVDDAKVKAHIEYKIAFLMAKLGETDPEKAKEAIILLSKFLRDHPDNWQVVTLPRVLVPLQVKNKDLKGAEKTLAALIALPKVPDSLRRECDRTRLKILLDDKQYDAAEKKLKEMIQAEKDELEATRFQIALANCLAANKKIPDAKKELDAVLKKSQNPDVRAMALNTLGECYQKGGEWREAMWQHLFVEVVYNQNPEEYHRALQNLHKVFKELKDEKREKHYAELIKKKE